MDVAYRVMEDSDVGVISLQKDVFKVAYPSKTMMLLEAGCPVLVMVASTGAADDDEERERRLALDDVQAARVAAGSPPFQVLRFDGVGHDLMRYRADAVSVAIADLAASTVR